jgi:hypothetical protein
MLEARKVFEDYETLKGFLYFGGHKMPTRIFTKATDTYLRLWASQRRRW